MSSSDPSVFISYAWGGEGEETVNQIHKFLQERGMKIIRDKRDLGPEGSLKDFMEHSRQGSYVIVVISDKYLRSPYCMFELTEIVENKQYHDRVFPIVLPNADIYNPVRRVVYIKYWEEKRKELDEAMKSVSPANLQGLREEIDSYDEIRDNLANLTFLLKDMNTLTPDQEGTLDFPALYAALEKQIREASVMSDRSGEKKQSLQDNTTVEDIQREIYSIGREGSKRGMEGAAPPQEPPRMQPQSPAEEVAFTAYHPKEAKVDTWHTLLVYTHLLSALQRVRQDAKRFEDEIKAPKETTSPATAGLVRGTEITIVPACEGVMFNPERLSLKWIEDVHRVEFRFKADPSLSGDAARGQITVYVGPLIIGTLKFAMLFDESAPEVLLEEEVQSRMYRKEAIFISYSHKDTEVALAFKKIHEATGHDVLIDIDDLRSGQEWNPELMRMIDRADIFQLFWSENSCQSQYCKQEWEHALKRSQEGFIRPVYWRLPLPDPPQELSQYHFEYVEL